MRFWRFWPLHPSRVIALAAMTITTGVAACTDAGATDPASAPRRLFFLRSMDPLQFVPGPAVVDTLRGAVGDSLRESALLAVTTASGSGVSGARLRLRHQPSAGAPREWQLTTDQRGVAPLVFPMASDTGMGALTVEGPNGLRLTVPTLAFRCPPQLDTLPVGIAIEFTVERAGCRNLVWYIGPKSGEATYTRYPLQPVVVPFPRTGAYVITRTSDRPQAFATIDATARHTWSGAVLAGGGSAIHAFVGSESSERSRITVRVDSINPAALPCGTHVLLPGATVVIPLPLANGCSRMSVELYGPPTARMRLVSSAIPRDSVVVHERATSNWSCRLGRRATWRGDTVDVANGTCAMALRIGVPPTVSGEMRLSAW